jgi:O-succinylbenzoate synthase
MEELHTDSIDGGHEGQLWARSRARERAYSNKYGIRMAWDERVKIAQFYKGLLESIKNVIAI